MSASLPADLFGNGVVAAPMAGGPSTPDLVEAVGAAGGLGFLGGGYRTPQEVASQLAAAHQSGRPFGINLFVPTDEAVDQQAILAYRQRLLPLAGRLGVELPQPRWTDDDAYPAKVEVVLANVPPVISFTFGLPPAADLARLKAAGAFTIQTVTAVAEARAAEHIGVDAVVVQHPNAGGHSGAFSPPPAATSGGAARTLPQLVAEIAAAVGLPVLAAGGIGTPEHARAARGAGAAAVQLGTAFLRTHEAGTNPVHRRALASDNFIATSQTRAFSGKTARGLQNQFMLDFSDAPPGYPTIHYLTAPLRAATVAAGDPRWTNLWAGTGWRQAREEPAGDVVLRFAT